MTTAAATPTSALHHARQVAGMAILALANPLVWYSQAPVLQWAVTWIVPLLIALVAFGLFALFFTKRAKQAWPGRFYMLAWILLALTLAGPWINMGKRGAEPSVVETPGVATPSQSTQPNPFSDPNYGKDLVR